MVQSLPADRFRLQVHTVATLQEAVNEQLGLKLKATKAPLDTLIVDCAERPFAN